MDTADVVRTFLQREAERGRLVPTKLAEQMGYAEGSSIMSMVLKGDRPFPMDRLDAAAVFFGFPFAEDFLRHARQVVQPGGAQETPAESFRKSPSAPPHERRTVARRK